MPDTDARRECANCGRLLHVFEPAWCWDCQRILMYPEAEWESV